MSHPHLRGRAVLVTVLAAALALVAAHVAVAASSTSFPRAVLMNVAPSRRADSSEAPIMPSVLDSKGACNDTTRLERISSSRLKALTPRAVVSSADTVGS